MHISGHQYILFYFLFQITVSKKHGKQNRKKCEIYKRYFLYAQLKLIDGVKYVYCIKHADKFLLREQLGFRPFFDDCVNVYLVYVYIIILLTNL